MYVIFIPVHCTARIGHHIIHHHCPRPILRIPPKLTVRRETFRQARVPHSHRLRASINSKTYTTSSPFHMITQRFRGYSIAAQSYIYVTQSARSREDGRTHFSVPWRCRIVFQRIIRAKGKCRPSEGRHRRNHDGL